MIIAVFLLNISAHFWFFWQPPFSGDEANQTLKALRIANGLKNLFLFKELPVTFRNIYEPILQHNHPPFEFLIFVPFLAFQPREFFLRLSSILVNVGLLAYTFYTLKQLRTKFVAICFLILYGTSLWSIWWGQSGTVILNLVASLLISLTILFFCEKPSNKSLLYLSLASTFSLLVSVDFIQVIPFSLLAIFHYRDFTSKSGRMRSLLVFLLIVSLFYIPWIIYSFLSGPPGAGFNYYIHGRLQRQSTIFINLQILWEHAFSYPGYITVWPFALLAFFLWKKVRYVKYVFLATFSYVLLFITLGSGINWYANIFSMLCILTAELIASLRKAGWILILTILVVNILSLKQLFIEGKHNPLMFDNSRNNNISHISYIAKKCFKYDDETYLTTLDPVTAEYYFGRPTLFSGRGMRERLELINLFDKNNAVLKKSVKFIIYQEGQVNSKLEKSLKRHAIRFVDSGFYILLFFKDCQY